MRSGWTGLGPKTEEFEKALAARLGVQFAIACNSGTAALHLALHCLTSGHGVQWEVITSPLTFASTAAVALYEGHSLKFMDINASDLCLNFDLVREYVSSGLHQVVIPVLYGGHDLGHTEWEQLGIPVIYDCAHAMGSKFDARGRTCCWSFHTVKNLSCGEGGAVTTDNARFAERLRKLRWLGIDKSTHERSTGSYRWDYLIGEMGYKYHMSDLNAALGLVQLEKLDEMQTKRDRIARRYLKMLTNLSTLVLPHPVVHVDNAWHLFYVLAPERDKLMEFLSERGISTGVHYKPLYHHSGFARYSPASEDRKVCDYVWPRLVSLPMFPDLSDNEQSFICESIKEFYK